MGDVLLNLYLHLLLALPVLYLSVFLHELGHCIMGRRSGFVVSSFGQGVARPLLVVNWQGTRMFLCLHNAFLGITFVYYPHLHPTNRQMIGMLTGGLLFNALAAVVALVLLLLFPALSMLWVVVAAVNGIFALSNALPFQCRIGAVTLSSDGALILGCLLGGTAFVSGPGILQALKTLTPLWDSIGDTQTRFTYQIGAAVLWTEVGDTEEALRLHAEAMTLSSLERDQAYRRAYALLVRGTISGKAGAVEEAEADFDAARREYAESGVPAGLLLTDWARAEMCVRYGPRPDEARQTLETLKADPFFATRPERRFALTVSCLLADASLGDLAGAENGVGRYAADRRRFPSPIRDLHVYRAMGGLYAKAGNPGQAQEYYDKALEAAKKLHAAFADEADRARFVRAQDLLLAEARAALEAQGEHEKAAAIPGFFTTIEETARQETEAQTAQERRWRRVGAWLTLLNFAVAGGGAFLIAEYRLRGTLAVSLLFFAICAVIIGIVSVLLLVFSLLGRRFGAFSAVLSTLPWLITFGFALALAF